VLFAVTLTLGCVWARWEEALVQRWCGRVLVVDMAVTLLLGRPAMFVVFALVVRALPWTLMGLQVLGEVARTLELFVAQRALMDLRLSVLLTPCHGSEDVILIDVDVVHGSLHGGRGDVLVRKRLASGETYNLSVLGVSNKLSLLPIVTHPTKEGDALIPALELARDTM
jgi:hypothetical protein